MGPVAVVAEQGLTQDYEATVAVYRSSEAGAEQDCEATASGEVSDYCHIDLV